MQKQGNWVAFNDDGNDDVRQHNEVNDIAAPSSGGGAARTYDGNQREMGHAAAGNLITLEENDGSKTWTFKYDYRNRLIMVESSNDRKLMNNNYEPLLSATGTAALE